MRKYLPHVLELSALLAFPVLMLAQGEHPRFIPGTWKLNVAKSKFNPGPPPRSSTVTVTPDGHFTAEWIDAQGTPHKMSHPWSDGKEVPVTGVENATWITNAHGDGYDEEMKVKGKTVMKV